MKNQQSREFEYPATHRWRVWVAPGLALLTLGLLLWAIVAGDGAGLRAPVAVLLIALVGYFLWALLQRPAKLARHIVIDPEGIRARTFMGRDMYLRWREIGEVKLAAAYGVQGRSRTLRLIPITTERSVVIMDDLPGYDEVVTLMRSSLAENVRWSERSAFLDRLFGPTGPSGTN